MSRHPVSLPLALPPRPPGSTACHWIYAAIRDGIAAGQLEPGLRLPATRDLARQYAVSRGTAVAAFELLQAEGYVESAVGSGTRVTRTLRPPPPSAPRRAPARRLSRLGQRVVPFGQNLTPSFRAFRTNQPALDLFPADAWSRVASRRLRRATADLLLGCDPFGHLPLRSAISAYLGASRGVACDPARIAVVSGVQEALMLVAGLLLDPGDRAGLEDPGYPGARRVLETAGARLTSIAVDGEGAVVPTSRAAPRLVYLTPAHQFPLGVCMTLARRLQWLAWARRHGALLFEDDYDSEFRHSGRPVSALHGLDREDRVVFAGSFSKVLCPSLRLGYLVVPPDLVDPVAALMSVTVRHASLFNQAVMADFIGEGHFARHLRRLREVYSARHAALLDGASRRLDGRLEVVRVEAGLQTVGHLVGGGTAAALVRAAAARDVEVTALSRFVRETPTLEGVQLGFGAAAIPEIERGVEALARILDRGPRPGRRAGA